MIQPVDAVTLGKVLGIQRARVVSLAASGVLPRVERGRYDLAACVAAYIEYRVGLAASSGDGETVKSLMTERARLARVKADQAEREARVEAGELVEASAIEPAWLAVANTIRSRMLAIPTRLATRMVGIKTPFEAEALLRKEIYAGLTELAANPRV